MSETYKSNRNVCYSCHYHVVWCPKYRRPVLTEPVAARLRELLMEKAQHLDTTVAALDVLPDAGSVPPDGLSRIRSP